MRKRGYFQSKGSIAPKFFIKIGAVVHALLWNLILEEDIIKIKISCLENCRLKYNE